MGRTSRNRSAWRKPSKLPWDDGKNILLDNFAVGKVAVKPKPVQLTVKKYTIEDLFKEQAERAERKSEAEPIKLIPKKK